MTLVRIKYIGGMSKVKANWTRKLYSFNKHNDFTLDVPDELAKDLLITGNYKVIPLTIPEQVHNIGIVEPMVEEEVEEEKEIIPVKKHAGRPKKGAK
jgi:hypothetical protein